MELPLNDGKKSAPFWQPRFLSDCNSEEKKLISQNYQGWTKKDIRPGMHPHAGRDLNYTNDRRIYSPVSGLAFAFAAHRKPGDSWSKHDKEEILNIPFHNYFYDIYGCVICIIENVTGRMHLFCHEWQSSVFGKDPVFFKKSYVVESVKNNVFAPFIQRTEERTVRKGDVIGFVGGAGQSTGDHTHYEIHPGFALADYEDRIDPDEYIK